MSYKWYRPEAHTKEQVIAAMRKKKYELLREAKFYAWGLATIASLHEKEFYEIDYYQISFFCQCLKFGRDHVDFRLIACNTPESEVRDKMVASLKANGDLSLGWHPSWRAKPTTADKAALYVGWPWKTEHLEKLLKQKDNNDPQ